MFQLSDFVLGSSADQQQQQQQQQARRRDHPVVPAIEASGSGGASEWRSITNQHLDRQRHQGSSSRKRPILDSDDDDDDDNDDHDDAASLVRSQFSNVGLSQSADGRSEAGDTSFNESSGAGSDMEAGADDIEEEEAQALSRSRREERDADADDVFSDGGNSTGSRRRVRPERPDQRDKSLALEREIARLKRQNQGQRLQIHQFRKQFKAVTPVMLPYDNGARQVTELDMFGPNEWDKREFKVIQRRRNKHLTAAEEAAERRRLDPDIVQEEDRDTRLRDPSWTNKTPAERITLCAENRKRYRQNYYTLNGPAQLQFDQIDPHTICHINPTNDLPHGERDNFNIFDCVANSEMSSAHREKLDILTKIMQRVTRNTLSQVVYALGQEYEELFGDPDEEEGVQYWTPASRIRHIRRYFDAEVMHDMYSTLHDAAIPSCIQVRAEHNGPLVNHHNVGALAKIAVLKERYRVDRDQARLKISDRTTG